MLKKVKFAKVLSNIIRNRDTKAVGTLSPKAVGTLSPKLPSTSKFVNKYLHARLGNVTYYTKVHVE